mgnify:CR=1 FL=1
MPSKSPRKKSDFQLVIERLLVFPSDNSTKEARSFWSRENKFFTKLYKRFPDYNFWHKVSFNEAYGNYGKKLSKTGKLPTFALFFNKDSDYWINSLEKKWKEFHWKPKKLKTFKPKNDVVEKNTQKIKKRSIRDFLS